MRQENPAVTWVKSARTPIDESPNCVEIAPLPAALATRDSKAPHAPALRLAAPAWRALLDGAGQAF
jgi:hypothetical protein